MQSLMTWWRGIPNGYRVIAIALAILGMGTLLIVSLQEPKLQVSQLRQAWCPDLPALGKCYRQNPMILPKDIPELEQLFSSLRMDLRGETAHITWGTKTWEGSWTTTPATGGAAVIQVQWGKGSPVGRATTFHRESGMIILTMDAGDVPLCLDDANAP